MVQFDSEKSPSKGARPSCGAACAVLALVGSLMSSGPLALVVRFTNNVVVTWFLRLRQRKLLKNAATHVLANPANPVE